MKKPGAEIALLTPDAAGWRVRAAGAPSQAMPTLGEAAQAIPAGQRIHLALPCHAALLERLTLPSTDRAELAGMVQLQLEKTLPYPVEQVSSDFEVVHQAESESTLLSIATHTGQLEELCRPLRDQDRLPQKITLYAMHVAASCPADQVVLCIWEEDAQLVVAICEHGKLGYAQTLPTGDAEMLLSELPRILLGAEMESVPTEFDSIRLEQGSTALGEPLRTFFEGKPVELMSFDGPLSETGGNLLPAEWIQETRRLERAGNLRQKLQMVVLVYLVLVAGAFAYLAFLKSRVQKVDRQLAETLPQVEYVKAQQSRWQALAPAVDPGRSSAEILRLLFENRPTADVKFTIFDHYPTSFRVQGEAPSATLAVEFAEKLRKEPGLEDFNIESGPPNILPTGSASFSVFGRL